MSPDLVDEERREFLKRLAALGLLAGAGPFWALPRELWAMAPAEPAQPVVARAEGARWSQLAGEALQKLGGMKKFVSPGEVVVVKPNMSWDRTPEMGANSHPAVVRQVVELCLECGAKRVKVMDGAIHPVAYEMSGIKEAVEAIGDRRATVERMDRRRFTEITLERFQAFPKYSFYQDILEADRFINIPVAKVHRSAKMTQCLKNMMGAIGHNRRILHTKLHLAIAELNLVLRPDLHVVDATRLMVKNGPTGGRPEDLEVRNLVFAGPDPVALDAHGATLFGLKPADVAHIARAFELGRGEMDLAKIKVV
jgi:uncharacterized protein (DUF362 family)